MNVPWVRDQGSISDVCHPHDKGECCLSSGDL